MLVPFSVSCMNLAQKTTSRAPESQHPRGLMYGLQSRGKTEISLAVDTKSITVDLYCTVVLYAKYPTSIDTLIACKPLVRFAQ